MGVHRAPTVGTQVTGGKAACHIIDQGGLQARSLPRKMALLEYRGGGFVVVFLVLFCFHVLFVAAFLFSCHVSSSSASLCSVKLTPDYL